ncbi:response regulator [Winogradskyella sp.]|uniref:response regulator n=1 Tax=Winogradskyella sp. TaxID=1883156 RepID=UPI003BAB6489
MINLVIAEDHNSLIDGIELFFEIEEDICIVDKVNDGIELLDVLRKRHVNMVITDIRMPRMDGIEVTKIISTQYPHIKVIAFTMLGQKNTLKKMMDAGAKGYLLKNASLSVLLEATRRVHKGETYYDPNVLVDEKLNGNIKKKSILTKRQQEILDLIAQGLKNREIADKLFIQVHTVGTHRKNMIEKLGLKGQNSLLKYALSKRYDSE